MPGSSRSTRAGWRMVDVPEPPRDRCALLDRDGYEGAVGDWHQARAELIRPVQLELGGKSPNVIFADADIDLAAAGAAFGIFYTQGENCNAGSRVLAHESVYDEVVEKVVDRARRLVVGPPDEEATEMGALISKAQFDKVAGYVKIGVAEGARLVCGGAPVTGRGLDGCAGSARR